MEMKKFCKRLENGLILSLKKLVHTQIMKIAFLYDGPLPEGLPEARGQGVSLNF
jgi:hypothetical protein